jgi:hypothetical protein
LSSFGAAKSLGSPLDEIRKLLHLVEGGDTCGEFQQAVGDHLKVIRPNAG